MDNFEETPQVDYQAEERLLVCSCRSIRPSNQSWKDKKGKHKREKKKVKRTVFNENLSDEGTTTTTATSLIPIETEDQVYLELPSLSQNYSEDDSIQLFGGLFIRRDGEVRLIPGLYHVTFGFHLGTISKVELMITQGIVDIELSFTGKKEFSRKAQETNYIKGAQEALQILHSNPDEFNQQVAKQVGQCNFLMEKLEGISSTPRFFRNDFKEEKDSEFQRFNQYSFDFIKQQPKSSMYSYNIGRINPQTEEMEILHSGYSQEYLALIGIDTDVLASLLLRKQKIELLLKTIDFNRLSANALKWMKYTYPDHMNDQYEFNKYKNFSDEQVSYLSEPASSQIITFDGFRLTLNQRLRVIYTPLSYLLEQGVICDSSCGYFLQIFEFDVELSELEQLIAYRQRLCSQSNSLSMQDFLSKELSLMFEDVEYSVRSSEFLEKYYSQLLPSLFGIQKQKEEQQKLDNLRCKYRLIYS